MKTMYKIILLIALIMMVIIAIGEVYNWQVTLDSLTSQATLTAAWNEKMMESVRMTAVAP